MLFLILVSFTLVYLGLPSREHYFDGLTFAMAVEGVAAGGDPAWLFHPHHLLYSPLAYAFYRLCLGIGLSFRALLAMHIMSAALAVLGLFLFHRMLRRMEIPAPQANAGVVLLGASYNYWHFATQGETTIPATVALLALLNLGVGVPRIKGATRACLLGLLAGGCILLHQTAAVALPAAGYLLLRPIPPRRRVAFAAAFLSGAFAVPFFAYLLAAVWALGLASPASMFDWMLGYFGPDPRTGYQVVYASWSLADIPASAGAWAGNFVGYWPGPAGTVGALWKAAAGIVLAAIFLSAANGSRRALPLGRGDGSRLLVMALLIMLLVHAVFFTWWKAGHVRFWLLALPAWLALAVAGLEKGVSWRSRRLAGGKRAAWLLALAVAAIVWAGPFRFEIRPASNRFLALSDAMAKNTDPGGTVIISGVGPYGALKAYVPYFAQRKMLILDWQFADKAVPPERALRALALRIENLRRREPVYILSEALEPGLDGHFSSFHGVPAGEIRRLLLKMRPSLHFSVGPGLSLLRL